MRTFPTLLYLASLLAMASERNSQLASAAETVYWEAAQLQQAKRAAEDPDDDLEELLTRLKKKAEQSLRRGPFSVTFKKDVPPSGDKHDYMSFSRYWWPDPDKPDGLPYVRRDGDVNRQLRQRGDRDSIGELFDNLQVLTLAYYLLGEEKYGDHAVRLIRTWFLDPETKMHPHLQYGQAVPGRAKGRGAGILDTRGFIKLLDCVALLESSNALSAAEERELKQWFAVYLDWLLTSELGKEETNAENNHGSWYAAQTARIALFTGNRELAEEIVRQVGQERLAQQFSSDGSQPAELQRTQSLHYSFFNLEALSIVARVGESLGLDIWRKSDLGNGLEPGLQYLMPFVSGKAKWPYPEKESFSLSTGTVDLLRMASVRYDDPSYLEPLEKMPHRYPDEEFGRALFQVHRKTPKSLSSRDKKPASAPVDQTAPQEVEITVLDDAPALELEFELPDLSGYSIAKIAAQSPKQGTGTATIGPAKGEKNLGESLQDGRLRKFQHMQGQEDIVAIKLQGGAITLAEVVRQVDDESAIHREGEVVTLLRPLLIKAGAVLVVDGKDTPELRLSTNQGAFLLNAGMLYVLHAKVTSWDSKRQAPTEYKEKKSFRPYLAAHFGSKTYLAGSTFEHLGYHAPTAYGVSLSSQPDRNDPEKYPGWPIGMIVGCQFQGLYYGFYSYEARQVAILDNKYTDCIVYGIDPHDRSTELIIARNTVTGTKEKHGIIGSRGVSQSFIVDNVTSGNNGSGIMLDRQCADNVIHGNKVLNNGQGIAIYESSSNTLAGNLVVANEQSGIRVRNSQDILVTNNQVVANGDYGLELTAKRLKNHAERNDRNDGYQKFVGVAIRKNTVAGNRRGLIKGKGVMVLSMSEVETNVDLAQLESASGLNEIKLYPTDDEYFGSELKPHANRLESVFQTDSPLVEYRKQEPEYRDKYSRVTLREHFNSAP